MALVFQKPKDDEENQGGSQPVTNNTGVIAPTAPAPVAAPSANKATSSGRFSNIKSYLDANKNFNAQGGGLAGKIASNLESSGQQVGQQINDATKTFEQKSQTQLSEANKGLEAVNKAIQNPVAAVNSSIPSQDVVGSWSQEQQDEYNSIRQRQLPSDVGPNSAHNAAVEKQQKDLQDFYSKINYVPQNNVDIINRVQNASYTGPKSLQDLEGNNNQAALQAKTKNYTDLVNQGQSETGRFNLLKNMFNKPSYTRGQQGLDNLLIQGNKEQLKKIQDTRALANTANQTLNTGIQSARQKAEQLTPEIERIRNEAVSKLTGAVTGLGTSLEDRAKLEQDRQTKAYNTANEGLKRGELSQDDYNKIVSSMPGFSQGVNTYGVDLTKYLTNTGNVNSQTVATPEEYATIQALNKLIGQNATPEASKVLQTYVDPSQAGKAGGYEFKTADMIQALKDAKIGHETQVKDTFNDLLSGPNAKSFQTTLSEASSIAGTPISTGQQYLEFLASPKGEAWAKQKLGHYFGTGGQLKNTEQVKNYIANPQAKNYVDKIQPFLDLINSLGPKIRKMGSNEVSTVQPEITNIPTGPRRPTGNVEVK